MRIKNAKSALSAAAISGVRGVRRRRSGRICAHATWMPPDRRTKYCGHFINAVIIAGLLDQHSEYVIIIRYHCKDLRLPKKALGLMVSSLRV